jgi:hypothetical protein
MALGVALLAAGCSLQATPTRSVPPAEATAREYLQALQDLDCGRTLDAMSPAFKQQTAQTFGSEEAFCAALKSHRRNRSFAIDSTSNQSSTQAVVQATIQKQGGANVLNLVVLKIGSSWKVDRIQPVVVQAVDLYMPQVTSQIESKLSASRHARAHLNCPQSGLISLGVGDGMTCSYTAGNASGKLVVIAKADGSWSWQPVS